MPETDPGRGSSGDSEGSSFQNFTDSRGSNRPGDSRGSRILALAAYLFLSLLGHSGPARGNVVTVPSSAIGPFNIAKDQIYIFKDKIIRNWGSADSAKTTSLITIEGGLAIFSRNVSITENFVHGVPLIDISKGGVMLVHLTEPGDYFRITGNVLTGSVPLVRASAETAAAISLAALDELAGKGFSPILASLAGRDRREPVPIRLYGTEGTLFSMTGNIVRDSSENAVDIYPDLISNAGGLLIVGPLDLWYDSLIKTKDLLFVESLEGSTSSDRVATLSMEIREFDCLGTNLVEANDVCKVGGKKVTDVSVVGQGGIIRIADGGTVAGAPGYLRPMPVAGKTFSRSTNNANAHYFEYLEFGTDVDAAKIKEDGLSIGLYPLMPKLDLEESAIAMGVVDSGENKNRVIYYVNTLGESIFHYGTQNEKVAIAANEFHIFRGDTVQGPIVFSNLEGGVIAPTSSGTENAYALLLGSAKFENIKEDLSNTPPRDTVAVLCNMANLFLLMPRDGDRIEFIGTSGSGFFDIAAVKSLYMAGVSNSRVVLDGAGMNASKARSFTLGGALDIGSHSVELGAGGMTFLDTALWPSLYLTVLGDFSDLATIQGGKLNTAVATTVIGGPYIIPRVPNGTYSSTGDYKYTYLKNSGEGEGGKAALTVVDFNPMEKMPYGIREINFNKNTAEEELRLVFKFASGTTTHIISGTQTTGLTVSTGNVITSEIASEPPHFDFTNCGTACGAAIDVEAGGSAYLVGSTLFEGVKGNPAGGKMGVLEVASGGKLEIHLPGRGDTTEFRSTASGVWDIHNPGPEPVNEDSGEEDEGSSAPESQPVIIEGVEGSRVILSGGIGGDGGSLTVTGPVRLEPGLAIIDQKDISFDKRKDINDDDIEGFPQILISSLATEPIHLQASGTLTGNPQLVLALGDGTLSVFLDGADHKTFNYIKTTDSDPTFNSFEPTVASAIEGSVVYGAALDPDLALNSFASQNDIVIYRKLRIISGSQSERIVVYGGQTVVNSGFDLVSFKDMNNSASLGGALLVAAAGTLELDARGAAGPIVFEGNRAKSGGAIYVDKGGEATLRGSFLFSDNKVGNSGVGGAIYSKGTVNFLLGAGDTVRFEAPGGVVAGADGIANAGTMNIEGVPGSVFELGKDVKVSDGGTLSIEGGLKLLLAGSIVQGRVSFPDPLEAAEFPTVAAVLEKVVDGNSELSGGTISADGGVEPTMKGKFFLDPLLPAGIYGASLSYGFISYSAAELCLGNCPLSVDMLSTISGDGYTATVDWSGSSTSQAKGNVGVTFKTGMNTKIISGQQLAQIVVPMQENEDILWSLVTNRGGVEPVVFSNMTAPVLKVVDLNLEDDEEKFNKGKAELRAPLFDSVKSSGRTTGEGVIEVNNSDKGEPALALYALAGETIEFRNTLALLDIYNEGTTLVTLFAANASLILSKGVGGGGELRINGPGQVLVGGSIDQDKITFRDINDGGVTDKYDETSTLRFTLANRDARVGGDRATPTVKLEGDGLEVGSIYGPLNIALAFANGMEHFTRGEFSYLTMKGNLTIPDSFKPRISKVLITSPSDGSVREEQDVAASKYFAYGDVNYDLSLQSDKQTIVLWGDLRGTIGERFAVLHSDKKIYGATFNGLDMKATANAVLEIGGGKTATVEGGGTTFSNNWGSEDSWPGAVEVKAGGTLRVNLPGVGDKLKFEANGVGALTGDPLAVSISKPRDIMNDGTLKLEGAGTMEFENGGIRGAGTLSVHDSAVLSVGGASVSQSAISFAEGTTLALEVRAFDGEDASWNAARENRLATDVTDGGGMLIIPDGGTGVTGSPKIEVTFSTDAVDELAGANAGAKKEYKYLYSTVDPFSDSQKPTLLSDPKLERDSDGKFVGIHIDFLEAPEDYSNSHYFQILTFEKVPTEAAVAGQLGKDIPAEEAEAMTAFFTAMLETDGDTAEEALKSGAEGIREIFQDNNPDSHVASQSKGMAAPIQDMAMALDDRMEESMASQSSDGDLGAALLLAAGNSKLAYGLLKGKGAGDSLHSRVWTKILLNSGTLKLEEERKVSGSGFLAGLDHRVR
ncbi:MAG: hypothetical protein LBU15_00645, partial [Rickettsiales bacterium]|nr:hypothetical protein [Rickettsiales bacterium]